MKKKYIKPEFNKYLTVAQVTNGWDTEIYPHGSNVSEGFNNTYNVWDCADAKTNEFYNQFCVSDSFDPNE